MLFRGIDTLRIKQDQGYKITKIYQIGFTHGIMMT